MFATYVAVTLIAAVAFAYAAVLNLTRNPSIVQFAEGLHVPLSWMTPLGLLLGAGSLGLLIGFAVPVLGTAAGAGLVLYFGCAAGAHLRVHDTRLLNWVNWAAFFSLAVAALAVNLAYRGPW